jgi:hypothetical protein
MGSPKKEKSVSTDKDKKPKLVRDSFTIPKDEYAALDTLKARAMKTGLAVKKSELLRAGLVALSKMGDADFKAALAAVPALKTGRPSQEKPVATTALKPKSPATPAPAGKKTAVQAKVAVKTAAPVAAKKRVPAKKTAA